ncbi:TusE/DsrC/DsvC family sulfur relay protein [Deltaproteobacteria bacterium TL4]
MNNYIKVMIYQMARRTGTTLTQKHLDILTFANEYYYKNKVGPLYHVLKNKLGVTKQELQQLFPHGLYSVYLWVGIPIQSPNELCKPMAKLEITNPREVYLDHNATTYLRDEVKKILVDYFSGVHGYGNASSSTALGKVAYEKIFDARSQIAKILKVSSAEIVFTSGGSEANNLALKGIAFNHLERKGHIVSSKIEHSSVLKTLAWLEQLGFKVTLLDCDEKGLISPQSVASAIRQDTILVSIMAVNNEIGTINPLEQIAGICSARNVPLMVDAVQAFGKLPLSPKKLGIALLSFSGHKIYAPKGVGGLFVDERLQLAPLIHGGGQGFGLRAGAENVGDLMALGRAAALSYAGRKTEQRRMKQLRDLFIDKLNTLVPGYIINGDLEQRLPQNLNVGFPGVDSGALLLSLNQIGVYASSGSACSSGSEEVSHVIQALKVDTDHYGVIRFSFGLNTTAEDLDYLFKYLPEILSQLKK